MSSPHRQNHNHPPTNPTPSNAHEAALQGAVKAFSKPPVKPKPPSAKLEERNAAYLAANGSWVSKGQFPSSAADPDRNKHTTSVARAAIAPVVSPKPQLSLSRRGSSQSFHTPPTSPTEGRTSQSYAPNPAKSEPPKPPPARRTQGNGPSTRDISSPPGTAPKLRDLPISEGRNSNLQSSTSYQDHQSLRHTVEPNTRQRNAYKDQSLKMLSPHVTGDSLANAIVGANLAISRNSSPRRAIPRQSPSPPDQKPPASKSRSNSPKRPTGALLNTLRRNSSSSSSSSEHHRRKWINRHPNKHHEGDRKRWRDKITPHELKRYEGVWASNKGMYTSSGRKSRNLIEKDSIDDTVQNLVVRDIWQRSRLPSHVLEEIWNLTDTEGVGRLTKSQFIVGLWLIDQRLKGRKVPLKVSDALWASVGGLAAGVKIRVK